MRKLHWYPFPIFKQQKCWKHKFLKSRNFSPIQKVHYKSSTIVQFSLNSKLKLEDQCHITLGLLSNWIKESDRDHNSYLSDHSVRNLLSLWWSNWWVIPINKACFGQILFTASRVCKHYSSQTRTFGYKKCRSFIVQKTNLWEAKVNIMGSSLQWNKRQSRLWRICLENNRKCKTSEAPKMKGQTWVSRVWNHNFR